MGYSTTVKNAYLIGNFKCAARAKSGYSWQHYDVRRNECIFNDKKKVGDIDVLKPEGGRTLAGLVDVSSDVSKPVTQTVQSVAPDPGCQDEGTTVNQSPDLDVERGFRLGYVKEPKRKSVSDASENGKSVLTLIAELDSLISEAHDLSEPGLLPDSHSTNWTKSVLSVDEVDLTDGELIEILACITVKEALGSEDRPQWLAAVDKERLKLELFRTWKHSSVSGLQKCSSALPVVLLLTKKRDNNFKCRAVALGNLYNPGGLELFAGGVSLPGVRVHALTATREGHEEACFDLDNAFLNSILTDEEVSNRPIVVRTPEIWREKLTPGGKPDRGLRTLLRGLSGLP